MLKKQLKLQLNLALTFWSKKGIALGENLPWLNELRNKSVDGFLAAENILKSENRFNKLDFRIPDLQLDFDSPRNSLAKVDADYINSLGIADGLRLVFVDGKYVAELTCLDGLENDVVLLDMESAISAHADLLREYICLPKNSSDAFNLAAFDHGVLLHVPNNVQISPLIEILYVHTQKSANKMYAARNIFILGKGSRVQVIERHVSSDNSDAAYLQSIVTSVHLDHEAELTYQKQQHESANVVHASSLSFNVTENAKVGAKHIVHKCGLSDHKLRVDLTETNAHFDLVGLYILHAEECNLLDAQIKHVGANGFSRVSYKGVLYDAARSNISGKVVAEQSSYGSDADLRNYNLLLGPKAQAVMQPELEVYVDDIKCSHGATCGQIDEEALFYLCSRGIAIKDAYNMLVDAFVSGAV